MAAWVVGMFVLLPAAIRAAGRLSGASLARLLKTEDGAVYSLSFLMVFPVYLWTFCLVVQCTWIFMVKGTNTYAAYATARSAIVWRTAKPASLRDERIRQAAVQAMCAQASYNALDDGSAFADQKSDEVHRAFRAHLGSVYPGPGKAFFRKAYRYAERATTVKWIRAEDAPDGVVDLEVVYQMPLVIPGVGMILGKPSPWSDVRARVYRMASRCALPNEVPVSEDRTVGIDYRSNNR